ncbi:hypothetical protein D3C87_1855920 [compost metagenome]
MQDQFSRSVLRDALIAITEGHLERRDHGLVCRIQQRAQLFIGAPADNVELEQWHRDSPWEKIGGEGARPPGQKNGVQARASTPSKPESVKVYLEVGMANSAPLVMLFGQRCITDFCLV